LNIDVIFSCFLNNHTKNNEIEFDSIFVEEAFTTLFVGVVDI
jgi:hypothetical protein